MAPEVAAAVEAQGEPAVVGGPVGRRPRVAVEELEEQRQQPEVAPEELVEERQLEVVEVEQVEERPLEAVVVGQGHGGLPSGSCH